VNLAVALAQQGARTGILDADIYGPNIPTMMGLTRDHLPDPQDGKLVPPLAYGVEVMSMGFLIPPGQAVIWRGPMLHGAIRQLFTDVAWGELDYLIVDMPPGTGDATLTLAQSVPVTGGIIVSTPQDVALEDAEKALVAFQRLEVPVLGIVENMAGDIFGEGGGERTAQRLQVPFLGRIYLDKAIREGGDAGQPLVAFHGESPEAKAFHQLAMAVAARVSVMSFQAAPELKII
jgi:ATP-binding protein involved in chromosome partitioning